MTMEQAHPYVIQLDRQGTAVTTTLTLSGRVWSRLPAADRVSVVENAVAGCIVLLLAAVVAFTRPHDRVARLGALVLGLLSIVVFNVTTGYASMTRRLPLPIALMVWWPFAAGFLLPPLFFAFCATFPKRLFHGRWAWSVALAPSLFFAMPIAFVFVLTFFGVSFAPRGTGSSDVIPRIGATIIFGYVASALVALLVNYRRLDLNERRRVRVLVAGTVLAVAPTLPLAVFSTLRLRSVPAVFRSGAYEIVVVSLFLALPCSSAYTILRHQLFDVPDSRAAGTAVHLGQTRAAGRCAGARDRLVDRSAGSWRATASRDCARARLAVSGSCRPGGSRIHEPATLAGWPQSPVLPRAIRRAATAPRRGRRGGRRTILRRRGAACGSTRSRPPFTPTSSRCSRARRVSRRYSTVAIAPAGHALLGPSAETKLVALVRLLGKPLEVPQTVSGWLSEQLPAGDTDFLRREAIHLIVPVATGADRREALLVLGRRRSEEPDAREDVNLLVAIAISLALLLDPPAVAATMRVDRFEACPQCGACYDSGATQCTEDGTGLKPVILPRLLDGRYRLERRLGQGGMGTVYTAVDTELERRIAVKVIREEVVGPQAPPIDFAGRRVSPPASRIPTSSSSTILAW